VRRHFLQNKEIYLTHTEFTEEFNDLYSSLKIDRIIKYRMRLAGNVACMGQKRNAY
jgi:hypothetical protein